MSASLIRARGLNTFKNELQIAEGFQTTADNVVIDRDNIIECRRGFNDYGDPLANEGDRFKQLLEYKNRIIRHHDDILDFDDGTGNFTAFSGSFSETQTGLRIKSQEANGNFYFTASDGV
jgi:hypothetical protein